MNLFFWKKTGARTPAQLYKGINAWCRKHPLCGRCMCNRCHACIEEETGMILGGLTYNGKANNELLICNRCLEKYTDVELAEFYAMFSSRYWHKPVSRDVVLATLIRKPSHSTIRRYTEDGKHIEVIINLDTGCISRSWSHSV